MTKYRIKPDFYWLTPKKNFTFGYKIQRKGWFFWSNVNKALYSSMEEAKKDLDIILEEYTK